MVEKDFFTQLIDSYIMNKTILVTGGLGYIGSHTILSLIERGYEPIIVDNLTNSHPKVHAALEKLANKNIIFYEVDVCQHEQMRAIFERHHPAAVIHFAAYKAVGESVEEPLKYYHNNINGLLVLLQTMKDAGCERLVFSSSCTVYGEPAQVPVTEDTPMGIATSPYGATKQMGATILRHNTWCSVQCLRYFNPVGAHPSGEIGELPLGVPNNLVPFLTQTVAGIRQQLTVFGNDYPTPDGTCIRDFIHVVDLAEAHVAAIERLQQTQVVDPSMAANSTNRHQFEVFNVGTGNGYSVKELIDAFENTCQLRVNYSIGERRAGDIIAVWADTTKARELLGWQASRNLNQMMQDAWRWQAHLMQSKTTTAV